MVNYEEIIRDISRMQERLEGIGRTLTRMETSAKADREEFRQAILNNREDIIRIKTKAKTASFFIGLAGGFISFLASCFFKIWDIFK